MKNFLKSDSLSLGLAMFSMFFGAGNVIFPLAVGQYAGDKNLSAMLGLILTAAFIPIAGVISMILFNGDTRKFFGRLGKVPGFLLAFAIIALLGPLGSTPRCIALAYTTLKSSLPISLSVFSALSCILLFAFTYKKNHIMTLLGWVLTPLLLGSLIAIICIGLFTTSEITPVAHSQWHIFWHGLKEGYNTMDLLAAFFFSSSILSALRKKTCEATSTKIAFKASIVGAILLTLIYMGFGYLAAFHATDLSITGNDELLAAITLKIAGPYAGYLVCITIALACLTTAIALISAFSDFCQKEIFKEKIGYEATLAASLLITFFVSTYEFSGISNFLGPILQIAYPGLIVLTALNIAFKLKNLKALKIPVFLTFLSSLMLYYFT